MLGVGLSLFLLLLVFFVTSTFDSGRSFDDGDLGVGEEVGNWEEEDREGEGVGVLGGIAM